MTDNLASLSSVGLRVEIEATHIMIARLAQQSDHFTPAMVAAHKRLELLEAERLHRAGSGFGKASR